VLKAALLMQGGFHFSEFLPMAGADSADFSARREQVPALRFSIEGVL